MRSWYFLPQDGSEWVQIGHENAPVSRDPRVAAVHLEFICTDNREEAEKWRQALAKGEIPSHDPAASDQVCQRWLKRDLQKRGSA
jgi:hypothetical protein